MFLLVLLACASDDGTAADDDTGGTHGCIDPVATILSPADGASVAIGSTVALEAEVTSSVADTAHLEILWAVEDDVVGTGTTATWVPGAEGTFLVRVQATDDCGMGEAGVHVTVAATAG